MINHILLEVYCLKDLEQYTKEPYPSFCQTNGKSATFQCLFHKCKFVDFTSCEDTLCYIGGESDELYGISYGGDMEEGNSSIGVQEWQEIAMTKIREAYAEFMRRKELSALND